MKLFKLFLLSGILMLLSPSMYAVAPHSAPIPAETTVNTPAQKELSRKEKREMRKAVKHQIRDAVKSAQKGGASDNLVLLIILAILIPPLAMLIYDGASGRFWLSLLLTILFFIPGMIYTLYVILSEN